MSRTQRYVLLSIILIIATFLRFYHFTSIPPGFYPDEAMDGNNAVEVAQNGHFQVFYPEDNGREGLYVNVLAVMFKIWPVYEPWMVRLPAAVAGVLTVLGLYLLVTELWGVEIGLLAAFLLATSVWHILFSRIGFRAILAPLLLVYSIYLLHKTYQTLSHKKAWRLSILAGVIYGLGFYSYIAYRITPLLFLLFIPFFRRLPKFWKRTWIFIAATFIVTAPLGLYFIQNPGSFFGRTAQISVTNSTNPIHDIILNIFKEAVMFNIVGDHNWRQNIAGAPELFWPVGILFVLGFGLGAYAICKRWRGNTLSIELETLFPYFGTLLLFAWLILGGLPATASDEGIPHALRSLLMVIPALVFATLGGAWLYQILKKYWGVSSAKIIASLFLISCLGWAYYDYFWVWAQNSNVSAAFNADYVTIGREINDLPAGTPKYVLVNAPGVIARGIPVPAETTIFITNSFTTQGQMEHDIHYLLPNQTSSIPVGTPASEIFNLN